MAGSPFPPNCKKRKIVLADPIFLLMFVEASRVYLLRGERCQGPDSRQAPEKKTGVSGTGDENRRGSGMRRRSSESNCFLYVKWKETGISLGRRSKAYGVLAGDH